MYIEKLPSGSYRITQMVDGKRYRKTVDHKPTQKEAQMLMSEMVVEKTTISSDMPFDSACKAYIESKSNVLSPTTKRRYHQYINNNISENLKNAKLSAITKPMVQADINDFAVNHAPKTVKNYRGFILAVLNYFGKNIKNITIPVVPKKRPYIPTEEEVAAIYEKIKGTMFEIPILLATYGMRRSEICALTLEDIDGVYVSISKALVQDENGEWVVKPYPKTSKSCRVVPVDKYITDLIREKGVIYDGFPGSIYNHLVRLETKLGIKHFSLHKFRHYFASYLYEEGVSDSVIEDFGGWDSGIWKEVYRQSMEHDEKLKEASALLSNVIFKK